MSLYKNIIITFDISSIAGRDQLAGVLRFLRERPDWRPRLISQRHDFTPDIVRHAKNEGVDGLIINHVGSPETEAALVESTVPLAVIGIRYPKLLTRTRNVVFIKTNNENIGHKAAKFFQSLGNFRSFGYVPATPPSEEWSLSREKGFKDELTRHGFTVSTFLRNANDGTEESYIELANWLNGLPKPTAIFGSWDYPAVQVLDTCRHEKLRVPREVSVLGVDNDPMICESSVPPLTSCACDYELQGYESATALAKLMDRKKSTDSPITVTSSAIKIVERESAAPIAPASQLIKRALRYIEQNACKGISTRDVASALGVSTSLLSLRFREFSSESVLDALIRVRLDKVMEMLSTTERKFTDIARDCGFRNSNHLKNLFKSRTGMSMREWRSKGAAHQY